MSSMRVAGRPAAAGDPLPLRATVLVVVLSLLWFPLRGLLSEPWRTPGSPQLYLAGLAGLALLLVPALYAVAKRTGAAQPPAWFRAHVASACAGSVLIVIHSAGFLRRPPALLLAVLLAVLALGLWARLRGSALAAAVFATEITPMAPPEPAARTRLRQLVARKELLLAALEPDAAEGTFSVSLRHLLASPLTAVRYWQLEREERRLLGPRQGLGCLHAWWRPLHLALGWLFVAGSLAHVIVVTFFAGYAAGDGPIRWWHVAAW